MENSPILNEITGDGAVSVVDAARNLGGGPKDKGPSTFLHPEITLVFQVPCGL